MAYSQAKGLIALPTDYNSAKKEYTYQKLSYKYIQPNGKLTMTPSQMQDLDSYVNGNGYLKRKVLEHHRTKIEWNTPYLTYDDKCKLISTIRKAFKQGIGDSSSRTVHARYYNDWEDDYASGKFYMPDVQFQYGGLYHGAPMYLPIRLALIEN